ncbi:hypothetical protein SAMN05414139_03806 [Burkholderia sp. D7]|nr:hypothetical protein SAMN05414139_03806 [Burkholderia sp. D7]
MSTSIKADQEEYRRLLAGHLATHQFPTSEAAVFGLHAALDCIYDPRPGFWAGLELETLIQAFVSQGPILRADEISDRGDGFRDEVERYLYLRRFDESCAMRILALPMNDRPVEKEQVYQWLMADFQSKGEFEYAEYLERDGYKGARAVLEFMAVLKSAATHRDELSPKQQSSDPV